MSCKYNPASFFGLFVGSLCLGTKLFSSAYASETIVHISSFEELAQHAAESGQTIRMEPGVYKVIDALPLGAMSARRQRAEWAFLDFSGSENTFVLDGVILELDTSLRNALRPPVHTSEFVVSGDNNTIQGLTINCIGEGTSHGGSLFSIVGNGTTLRDCTFTVRGSRPYGYGDLFGKGGNPVIFHHKHSGVHIVGSHSRLYNCKLYMRSFGHGFYIQGGTDHYFENCYVEGVMRSTNDMLAETEGPAFDVDFAMKMRNRKGEHKVLPGYMKSLAEDGFRTYGDVENLTFIHCTAKSMRSGWEMRTRRPVKIVNCTAVGNERGFWVSGNAVVTDSRGDAEYGPLLFVEGDGAQVELELLPAESDAIIHALALIHGSKHNITLKPARSGQRTQPLPVKLGYGTPGAGEGMAAIPERPARRVTIDNQTDMPVILGRKAAENSIESTGPVRRE
jgi:hypothetical protein